VTGDAVAETAGAFDFSEEGTERIGCSSEDGTEGIGSSVSIRLGLGFSLTINLIFFWSCLVDWSSVRSIGVEPEMALKGAEPVVERLLGFTRTDCHSTMGGDSGRERTRDEVKELLVPMLIFTEPPLLLLGREGRTLTEECTGIGKSGAGIWVFLGTLILIRRSSVVETPEIRWGCGRDWATGLLIMGAAG
jgi:hypothetical protein